MKSKLPLEAMRNKRPPGEGDFAGKAEGYGGGML